MILYLGICLSILLITAARILAGRGKLPRFVLVPAYLVGCAAAVWLLLAFGSWEPVLLYLLCLEAPVLAAGKGDRS